MEELLNWCARNGNTAFGLCVFLIIMAGFALATLRTILDAIINALRAFTGKYPAPRPIVQCDCPDEDDSEDEDA